MNNNEFENLIRKTLRTDNIPDRASFARILSQLGESAVTESSEVRYTNKTATSNIINNTIASVSNIWKSKRFVLVPSLILFLLVGAFSLSPTSSVDANNIAIQKIAEQDASIEDYDTDDQILFTSFDEPSITDLSTTDNEL